MFKLYFIRWPIKYFILYIYVITMVFEDFNNITYFARSFKPMVQNYVLLNNRLKLFKYEKILKPTNAIVLRIKFPIEIKLLKFFLKTLGFFRKK